MDSAALVIILVTLIFSAFFSGTEIAYLTASRLRIELAAKRGMLPGRIMAYFAKNPARFLTTTLVGNNIALVIYSINIALVIRLFLIQAGVDEDHDRLIFLFQTVIGSIIVLILGEFIPKALFRTNPNAVLNILALPFFILYILLYALVIVILAISQFILRTIFGIKMSTQTEVYDHTDLFHYVTENVSTGEEENDVEVDTEIFKNAIEFPSLKVRDCMIPRTDIESVDVSDSIETLKKGFIESGHSKLLVYRETIDNVIGYVHLVDLYRNPVSIEQIIIPIIIATEAMPASELLKVLIEKRKSVAVVIDEFGGTSGMITTEDILEEIIGDIEDEHDKEEFTEKKISDNEYVFSARLEIDYLNEEYSLNLPEGDYDTLGGLILYIYQSIPRAGDVIIKDHFEFTILSVDQTKIEEVRMKIVSEEVNEG